MLIKEPSIYQVSMNRLVNGINRFFMFLEKKLGLSVTSVFCGFLLLVLAFCFTTSRWELFYHGRGFSRLSLAPFDLSQENDLRFRILSPLLGYILFLRGPMLKYLMLIFLALFFGLVYFFHRKKEFSPAESAGMVATMAFSTLAFYQFYFPGYNDPLSYILILACVFLYKNHKLAGLFLSLMLFNHDNTIFLFPFFYLLLLDGNYSLRNIFSIAIVFVCALIPYLAFRYYMATHTIVGFSREYYFDPNSMKWIADRLADRFWQGFFQAFRLFWILPLAALFIDFRQKRFNEIFLMIVALIFVLSQLIIAHDFSRLIGLAFPVILIGAWRLREFIGTEKFSRILWLTIIINLFVPSYYIGALEPIALPPFWWIW